MLLLQFLQYPTSHNSILMSICRLSVYIPVDWVMCVLCQIPWVLNTVVVFFNGIFLLVGALSLWRGSPSLKMTGTGILYTVNNLKIQWKVSPDLRINFFCHSPLNYTADIRVRDTTDTTNLTTHKWGLIEVNGGGRASEWLCRQRVRVPASCQACSFLIVGPALCRKGRYRVAGQWGKDDGRPADSGRESESGGSGHRWFTLICTGINKQRSHALKSPQRDRGRKPPGRKRDGRECVFVCVRWKKKRSFLLFHYRAVDLHAKKTHTRTHTLSHIMSDLRV